MINKWAAVAVSMMMSVIAANAVADDLGGRGSFEVIREFGTFAEMRDGVRLATDIYRPKTDAKVPTILVRTPYLRTAAQFFSDGHLWASYGYAFAVQDVRGRGDSEGEFNPIIQETADGFDAQNWVAAQTWSDGQVGTIGGSYMGWTQVLPASLNSPALKAMIPIVTPPDPGGYYPMRDGGIYPAMIEWLVTVSGRTNRGFPAQDRNPGGSSDLVGPYFTLPIQDIDIAIGQRSPIWREYLANLDNAQYWKPRSYQHRLHEARVPMLHVTGWYDGTLGGSLQNFELMRRKADSVTRDQQYLVVGPWRHWVDKDARGTRIGEIDFGPASRMDTIALYRDWFDHYLQHKPNDVPSWPRVRVFLMNANRWLAADDWPLPEATARSYFLRQGDGSVHGRLSTTPPTGPEKPDHFSYDPDDPTPFIWEQNVDSGGPDDYRLVDQRDDVVNFELPAPDKPVAVCGPVSATLYAASSARDTDWVARLSLVHPDGYVQRLTEGWVRARARNGDFRNDPIEPNAIERYTIDLWGTCVELRSGYRLRLSVMSSLFPLLARNLNTGGDLGSEVDPVVARQIIYHDQRHSSYVTLHTFELDENQNNE